MDHVLVRVLEPGSVTWPDGDEGNPFVRYRSLFHAQHLALAGGLGDGEYRALVDELNDAVARVDGRGFCTTPFARADELSARLGFAPDGGVWVKDETRNVSGSHKARHMMGVALHLAVVDRLGLDPQPAARRLAIASCGNAALAAAVVARAAGRPLDVFVPVDASPSILARLKDLGASVTTCPREAGVAGDPTYHRLKQAIAAGSLPFTCQGNENGLVVEGGETLGWEIVSSGIRIDRMVVQVGGGALASSLVQSMQDAALLGAVTKSPRIDTVQTEAAYPLKRAHDRVAERVQKGEPLDESLRFAATHRSQFMWPWETEPHSVAHGILDDETYDWFAVVSGMLRTGGVPVVVDEARLEEANALAQKTTGIDVDHTGSSGLAGLMSMTDVDPHEHVAVLFTGVRR